MRDSLQSTTRASHERIRSCRPLFRYTVGDAWTSSRCSPSSQSDGIEIWRIWKESWLNSVALTGQFAASLSQFRVEVELRLNVPCSSMTKSMSIHAGFGMYKEVKSVLYSDDVIFVMKRIKCDSQTHRPIYIGSYHHLFVREDDLVQSERLSLLSKSRLRSVRE